MLNTDGCCGINQATKKFSDQVMGSKLSDIPSLFMFNGCMRKKRVVEKYGDHIFESHHR